MIELTKPEFAAGNEDKFYEVISKITNKDKVALISHVADLDGIASAKIVSEVIKVDLIKYVDYKDINSKLSEELKKEAPQFVIITDLMIGDVEFIKEVEKFAKVIIIDHHLFEIDHNSDGTVFMNSPGYCASYLAYYLLSKKKDISTYDWIIACSSVSDWCYTKNADWLKKVYDKYGQTFIPNMNGVKQSKFWDIIITISNAIIYFRPNVEKVFEKIGKEFGDIGDLKKYGKVVDDEINNMVKGFEDNKMPINDGYYYEFSSKYPIKSVVTNIVSEKYLNKTIIILFNNPPLLEVSARRQDGKVDLSKLLRDIGKEFEGSNFGGHHNASGGHILLKDSEKFKNILKKL